MKAYVIAVIGCLASAFASAAEEARPLTADEAAKEVLEVRYEDGSGREVRQLTLGDLASMPQAGFDTTTIWTDGVQRFDGVWLQDVFAHLGLEKGTVELSALNEYLVDFVAEKVPGSQAMIAYRHNGALMSPRERGPLWVVYPYDEGPHLQTEMVYVSSIWQLDLMIALP
ncbi:oxidoreductase [Thalassobius sp. Cn5-15]|uniref:oxidoreductase n=1 Tax=Thalassobius sp. Cn5-15 TaxID=2917763 RepID=UPI001EF21593|nr:oxidoreductase [Thalassobius sp. Cn5-15]MCG7492633.1 oxidoreductase [Thalassobius sp. Cn5-15]